MHHTVAADEIRMRVKIGQIFVIILSTNVTMIERSVKVLVRSGNPTGRWRLLVSCGRHNP